MATATAGGKVILFGEHAVVYGRPAIAVPISQLRAHVSVTAGPVGRGIRIWAADFQRDVVIQDVSVAEVTEAEPLALAVRLTLDHLGIPGAVDLVISVQSDLPVARGLGSGAAVATAIVRGLAGHYSRHLGSAEQSALVYEVEKLHHGTPSGIDNTVIAFEQPVYFVKGQAPQIIALSSPFTILVADTGVPSSTRAVVDEVRGACERDRATYEDWFDEIGRVSDQGRACLEAGDWPGMGALMDENHALLRAIGVSSPALDSLTRAARQAGAWGAKLCGAGRGGNMIALVNPERLELVTKALVSAGAIRVIPNVVAPTGR